MRLQQRRWRGVFTDGKFVGTIEEIIAGRRWYAYGSGGVFIGAADTAEQAAELVESINSKEPE